MSDPKLPERLDLVSIELRNMLDAILIEELPPCPICKGQGVVVPEEGGPENKCTECVGAGTIFDPKRIDELFDSLQLKFEDKVLRAGYRGLEITSAIKAHKDEIKRLKARQLVLEQADKRLKKFLMFCLETTGRDKVENEKGLTVQKWKNPAPEVLVTDMAALEKAAPGCVIREWVGWSVSVDKREIAQFFKDNETAPEGATVTVGYHVRIR